MRSMKPDQMPGMNMPDMQMPGTTGSALASELRAVTAPGTILLAMSGSQPPQDALSQFDSFLMKPFGVEQFAQTVERPLAPAGRDYRGSGSTRRLAGGSRRLDRDSG